MKLLSSASVRRCLIPDPGYSMITADFDQIELRVAAALSGEQVLIEAAKRGESLHKIAAVKLFGPNYTGDQYRYTKNVNFGWLYGGGAATLSRQAGIPLADAVAIIKQYEEEFSSLTAYKRKEQKKILQSALTAPEYKLYSSWRSQMAQYRYDTPDGRYQVARLKHQISRLCYGKIGYAYTPFGRRVIVSADKAYTVVNYIIQCSAADILKLSLLRVMADPVLEPTVLLPIHDEILGQAPIAKAERIAKRYGRVMSTEFMGVPITASGKVYGKSWGHGYISKG